jgi:hypothetical protein
MKVGTLLKGSDEQPDDIGVVCKATKREIIIHWARANKREPMLIADANKWIIAGYLKVLKVEED